MSYANDMTSPEVEIAGDAIGGSFLADAKSRHADLKQMLDGTKDNLKMDAMKRIINMMAKGKDCSDLFPAVVKNVAAKQLELKKLVYVYLVRYAEEQQDLALLSISTFQRALKDPNQLIRASALRVLSSIRVPMITPILMLAIKESMRDMSAYVRKVAAHAIPKLYTLDPEQKEQLIEVIDHLLADKTTLVVGSAVYAFDELCPERIDLIHKHFRKLCQLMVDVDEWGQVIIINLLTRYARCQFTDPNLGDEADDRELERNFYGSDSSDEEEAERKKQKAAKPKEMDSDLRALLRNAKPLLQSRNSAVVMAVAQLFYHVAPRNEIGVIAKSLIRLLRSHREVQSVVLMNIATISAKRRVFYAISKNMFEPFLKSFFVRSSEPTHIKLLKLEILTNLATQTNISMILREFQTYVHTHDDEFAASAIDAIGRCAANINEVADVCLSGLVALMSSKNEAVVAQSVIVMKRLLQLQPSAHKDIIVAMAKLVDRVKVPHARASIVWLIGEYCQSVPHIAPDVLRKMAKSFIHEEEMVKLQVINLAVKLWLTNRAQTELLVQYVFQLARYDQSYDLRDRARFLRNLVMPQKANRLSHLADKMFLSPKPAPVLESTFKDRDQFQLGTLSHYLNQRCAGYTDLPVFPETAPDGSARNVADFGSPLAADTHRAKLHAPAAAAKRSHKKTKGDKFYSDDESETTSGDEDESSEGGDGSSTVDEEDEEEDESGEITSASDESETTSSSESDAPPPPPKPTKKPVATAKANKVEPAPPQAPVGADLLLDIDFGEPSAAVAAVAPVVPPSTGAPPLQPLAPLTADRRPTGKQQAEAPVEVQTAPAQLVPQRTSELLNRVSGRGVACVLRHPRSPSLFSSRMCSVELQFTNHTSGLVDALKLAATKLPGGMQVSGFPEAGVSVPVGQSTAVTIGIDFADTTQPAVLELSFMDGEQPRNLSVSILAAVGEQLEPILLSPQQFKNEQSKLSGMNETSGKFALAAGLVDFADEKQISFKVFDVANVAQVSGVDDRLCYAGRTLSAKSPVLISLSKTPSEDVKLVVNCEKMVIGSMLFKHLKTALMSA